MPTNKEPSVLDYVKALLTPWRGAPPEIPPGPEERPVESGAFYGEPAPESPEALHPGAEALPAEPPVSGGPTIPESEASLAAARPAAEESGPMPWRALLALGLALAAQVVLSPAFRNGAVGAFLYILAGAILVWAVSRGEWRLPELPESWKEYDGLEARGAPLLAGVLLAGAAFGLFSGNQFTRLNVLVWMAAAGLIVWSFWNRDEEPVFHWERVRAWLRRPELRLHVTRWGLLALAAGLLVVFLRVYRIGQVPPEMVSDHAEKLLDVWDVLHGQHRIFFPRNTGREAIQFYLTAAIATYLGTGISYLSLKIGTITAGLLTLPFVYLLGKELGNRKAGLYAAFFAGIAYWPNVISRAGLRFPFYALFAAPVLFFLLRGMRRGSRNDFILAGIALGLGLHGYTPFRIMPIIVLVAVGLYLLHRQSRGYRQQTLWGLAVLVIVSLVLFLPLARFWLDNPDLFGFRAFSRVGSVEQPLPGPAWRIFLSNTWNALLMFSWDDGQIWPVSIPHIPALDVVSAALFNLGVLLAAIRYVRRRNWADLFILLSIPLLMLPSILSLAFPGENPAPNRASGVLVPVFVLVGMGLEGLLDGVRTSLGGGRGRRLAAALALGLAGLAVLMNYNLVFDRFYQQYRVSAWNTSEMGAVIRDFGEIAGDRENAWVVAYPHWVDTRLVGIHSGDPTRDAAIFPEHLEETVDMPGAKLFLVKPEDEESLHQLIRLYPEGWLEEYQSAVENKNFMLFFAPPP